MPHCALPSFILVNIGLMRQRSICPIRGYWLGNDKFKKEVGS